LFVFAVCIAVFLSFTSFVLPFFVVHIVVCCGKKITVFLIIFSLFVLSFFSVIFQYRFLSSGTDR